ncbi:MULTISPECIES: DUF4198 domain-containing protein [Acinetobacter]|jgi:hypothetical protein|uniref:DUF4198 domain-containing protein n=1 Tax=Acinetobacter chengduensis TaxID=2420890 RepID=A0ABX9TXX3_9GAMM|nr:MULTISPECIES: DUF4198 domain-containing protein [Acinetobacter]MBI1450801.1 DUF4198 domain-containing protein [Acinetobacter sp. FL51]RKG42671.1 DUF4198 domain-containing protein [Acinetobacter sp. WCHAc060007]RLL22751.1 DUF4198 domain-containing protein [Acinetobacter chengduensis]
MNKTLLTALIMGLFSTLANAHAPYTAPVSFNVTGGHSAVLAGFADAPFDSEVAIRGFEFKVITPSGATKSLNLTNTQTVSVGDIETTEAGTYQILGQREAAIKYAKVGQRWLRILDTKGAALAPAQKNHFIAESELTNKMQQMSVMRFDEVRSYFSKQNDSDLMPVAEENVNLKYSVHPRKLRQSVPLTLTVTVNKQPAQHFKAVLEKQKASADEQELKIETTANARGELQLQFPVAGNYILTLTSPELDAKQKPEANTYRTIVSLNVQP